MSTARRCDSVILCTQGCMLKHSLGAFSSGKMTLGPNERDTSSITYCGRSLASSAPFRGGVVDQFLQLKFSLFIPHVYILKNYIKNTGSKQRKTGNFPLRKSGIAKFATPDFFACKGETKFRRRCSMQCCLGLRGEKPREQQTKIPQK